MLGQDQEERRRYEQRKSELAELEGRRRIQNIEPGEELDARDTEYIWCQAVVRLTMNIHKKGMFVVVHYLGWSNVYDEAIPISSRRLAKRGFYTRRRGKFQPKSLIDIPRYILENRRGGNYYAHITQEQDDEDFSLFVQPSRSPSLFDPPRVRLFPERDPPWRSRVRDHPFGVNREQSISPFSRGSGTSPFWSSSRESGPSFHSRGGGSGGGPFSLRRLGSWDTWRNFPPNQRRAPPPEAPETEEREPLLAS